MRTVALVLALMTSGGCALAAARSPDLPVRVEREPSCNSGKGAVFADGLGGGLFGLTSLGLLAAEEPAPGLVFGLAAAAFIGSAVSGSRSADRCRAARAEYQALVVARDEQVAVQRAVIQTERRLRAGGAAPVTPTGASPVDPFPGAPAPTGTGATATTPTGTAPPVKPPVAAVKPVAPVAPVAPVKPPVAPPAAQADDDESPADDGAGGSDWAEFWREVKP
ncbi:MAG: hypothetical protein KBG48_13100 [Kofleriaceae bacterium]|nr:hypothetical protein [Kofleriaceae bacterium]MBP9168324.1 hypothetical protein [Kofleriaceae bacterium]MBP9857203.1 hypothetical protein [Kofleriaceae bacterium]